MVFFIRRHVYVNIFMSDSPEDFTDQRGFHYLRNLSVAPEMEGRDFSNVFIDTSRESRLVEQLGAFE